MRCLQITNHSEINQESEGTHQVHKRPRVPDNPAPRDSSQVVAVEEPVRLALLPPPPPPSQSVPELFSISKEEWLTHRVGVQHLSEKVADQQKQIDKLLTILSGYQKLLGLDSREQESSNQSQQLRHNSAGAPEKAPPSVKKGSSTPWTAVLTHNTPPPTASRMDQVGPNAKLSSMEAPVSVQVPHLSLDPSTKKSYAKSVVNGVQVMPPPPSHRLLPTSSTSAPTPPAMQVVHSGQSPLPNSQLKDPQPPLMGRSVEFAGLPPPPVFRPPDIHPQSQSQKRRPPQPLGGPTAPSAAPAISKTHPPQSRLRVKINSLPSSEEVLQSLTKQQPTLNPPVPKQVCSVYMMASLNKAALKEPLFAFQKIFQSISGIQPLGVSLVAKSMVEIFIFKEDLSKAQESLGKLNFLAQCPPVLSVKDIPRRAATHNRSFRQELTMATFQDFPKSLQWEFLNHAEQRIPFLPQHRQLLVKAQIQRERLWVSTPSSPSQI